MSGHQVEPSPRIPKPSLSAHWHPSREAR